MYWWVNHKQTWKQEIDGEYLWSPKFENSGARSQFYLNMRRARPGDLILSFAHAQISHVGCVSDFAFTSPKPAEFATTTNEWAEDGWLLPVAWTKLPKQVRPSQLTKELSPVLPAKYSPFNCATGSGNQKAYLAEISQTAFEVILNAVGLKKMDLSISSFGQPRQDQRELADNLIEDRINSDTTLSLTERKAIVSARRGQGVFRQNTLRILPYCRVTGLQFESLLIASHIKPWRSCETAFERTDGYNGMMLAPHIDRLFDKGFISFTDGGSLIISNALSSTHWSAFGISDQMGNPPIHFPKESHIYLGFHRTNVLL